MSKTVKELDDRKLENDGALGRSAITSGSRIGHTTSVSSRLMVSFVPKCSTLFCQFFPK